MILRLVELARLPWLAEGMARDRLNR